MPTENRDDPSSRRAAHARGHIFRNALPEPPSIGYSILYTIFSLYDGAGAVEVPSGGKVWILANVGASAAAMSKSPASVSAEPPWENASFASATARPMQSSRPPM